MLMKSFVVLSVTMFGLIFRVQEPPRLDQLTDSDSDVSLPIDDKWTCPLVSIVIVHLNIKGCKE